MNELDLLSKLNDEQKKAVTHKDGPLMIVAGAGTGKTTVVTHRIAWLVDNGYAKPEEILALTFTDKAASEMEERVDRLLPYGYVDLQISTFHSFAEKLLRKYGAELGLSRDFQLVTELDAWLLARQNFDYFELDYYRPLGNPTKYIRSLLTHFSRAKDVGIGPDDYSAFVEGKRADLDASQSDDSITCELARLEELANAYATYQNILLEHDCLDFGDLMLYTLKLLRKRPNVCKQIQKQFKYVLVDEFQDTNDAQYEIVKMISEPLRNLTVVGDDDQSIYKFRGASLANILRFEDDYPDATRVVLTKNYRSAQAILDRAHAFIQHNNPNRLEAVTSRALSKKLQAMNDIESVIHHIHTQTQTQEVAEVVKKILDISKSEQDTSWSDFAILVRSNAAGMDFATALERHRIPYQFLALSGLYTKPVILDLLALLRVVDNVFDSPSLYRVLTSPICGVSQRTIMELNYIAEKKGKPLFVACESLHEIENLLIEDIDILRRLLDQIKGYQLVLQKRKVSEMFVLIAKESGYLEYLNSLSEQKKLDNFSYLQQFYQRLKSFERRDEHPVLHNFLKEFAHERDAGEEGSLSIDLEAGPDVVRIMTVHAAKGLEFKHVFVVNLVAQRFPTNTRADAIPLPEEFGSCGNDKDSHLEEERRLFYVALTRAKIGLYLTSADDYGGTRKRKLSRFLHEIGFDVTDSNLFEKEFLNGEETTTTVIDDEQTVQAPIPKQFSFTQLAAFKTCPLQYKFAHVLKVPVIGKWTFAFGKTVHNTLQNFFLLWIERSNSVQTNLFGEPAEVAKMIPVSLEELHDIYYRNWLDDWYQNDNQRNEYTELGIKSLKDFYKKLVNKPPEPLTVEQGFTIKFGDVVLKGRIDRIDRCDGGVEIIDYKTGTPKTEKTLSKEDKEQLFLYQLAARDVLGLVPKKLTFYYLQDNSSVSFIGTDDQLLDFQDVVIERAKAVRSSNFEPSPGFHCAYCDYSDICEFRQ